MLKSLRLLFLVSIPTLAVTLLVAEAVLRLAGYVPYFLNQQAFEVSDNENLIYALRPNFRGQYAGVPINVNSQGLRGAELPMPTDATLRIVVAGDSIAFGQGVNEHETLSEQLRSRLQKDATKSVIVANLGIPGYDTCQEYARFIEKGLPLSPHMVLLIYYENDVDPTPFRVKHGVVYSPDVRDGRFGDFMAEVRKKSALYNLVWTRWQMLKHRARSENFADSVAGKFISGQPGWERSKSCLQKMVAKAGASSIKVVVIPFPVLGGLSQNPYPLQRYIDAVCAEARLAGAECLDIVPLLRDPSLRLTISSVETHPSAEVYGRIASHIAQSWTP